MSGVQSGGIRGYGSADVVFMSPGPGRIPSTPLLIRLLPLSDQNKIDIKQKDEARHWDECLIGSSVCCVFFLPVISLPQAAGGM